MTLESSSRWPEETAWMSALSTPGGTAPHAARRNCPVEHHPVRPSTNASRFPYPDGRIAGPPVANPRHEADTQQMRETENRRRLALGIRMRRGRLNVPPSCGGCAALTRAGPRWYEVARYSLPIHLIIQPGTTTKFAHDYSNVMRSARRSVSGLDSSQVERWQEPRRLAHRTALLERVRQADQHWLAPGGTHEAEAER